MINDLIRRAIVKAHTTICVRSKKIPVRIREFISDTLFDAHGRLCEMKLRKYQ
jgi:hypothetical protein